MIIDNENHFSTSMMCRLLLVSRSGYYAWKHRPPSVREQSNRLLTVEAKRVFDDGKGRPGAPRIPVGPRTKANQPVATV
jgi:putative transposase